LSGKQIKTLKLNTTESFSGAIKFYEKNGFATTRKMGDIIYMEKRL